MTDEKWEELYRRLDYVNPNLIRVMDVASWRYYKGLDEDNQPILDFTTQELKSLYKLLEYCQKRNITVFFGEWGAPGFWKKDKKPTDIDVANDSRWIGMISEYLGHLILEKGYTCIKYYNLVNEPNGYWASTDGDWDQWKSGYLKLRTALKEKGLENYISLSGPDAVVQWDHPTHPKKAFDWVFSTISELDSITSVYDIHVYADQNLTRKGNLEPYLMVFPKHIQDKRKPIILGELGMKYTGSLQEENIIRGNNDPFAGPDDSNMFVYDYFYGLDMADAAMQSMLAGFGGAIAWNLDDAMHTVGDLGEKDQLKKWGMWNILAEEFGNLEEDIRPRPWSYPWTLLCNLFLPNSTVYRPSFETKNDSVRAVASVLDKDFTVAIVNQSKTPMTYSVQLDIPLDEAPLYVYEYSENHWPVNTSGFPIASKMIEYKDGKPLTVTLNNQGLLCISTILLE